jgi:GDP-L-fucose synthase
MTDGCMHLMELADERIARELLRYPKPCFVNLGTGDDITIRKLAETVCMVVGYTENLIFDPTKPDVTPRKLQDVSGMHGLAGGTRLRLKKEFSERIGCILRISIWQGYSYLV